MRTPAGVPVQIREMGTGTGTVRALAAVGDPRRLPGADRPMPNSHPAAPDEAPALDLAAILQFYYPLALTSFIGLTTQPILTFFMGRAPAPVESLALFPVVMALYFLFGTLGLSYQEAAIALVGRRGEHQRELGRFAAGLAVAASGGLGLITFTPMARVWFEGVSGLEPTMAALAFAPAQIITLAPALSVIMGFQRALLVRARRTRPITVATAIEVTTIAFLFPLFGWGLGWMGVTAAMAALICGRLLGVAFLTWRVWGVAEPARPSPNDSRESPGSVGGQSPRRVVPPQHPPGFAPGGEIQMPFLSRYRIHSSTARPDVGFHALNAGAEAP